MTVRSSTRRWKVAALGLALAAAAALVLLLRPDTVTETSMHLSPRTVSMPGFGRDEMLGPSEIADLTEYVLALSGRSTDNDAVVRALPLYANRCAVCHGVDGLGDETTGTPDLTDDAWIHGGDRDSIHAQIWNGNDGRGPMRQASRSRSEPRAP